jgi:hypothetical protein
MKGFQLNGGLIRSRSLGVLPVLIAGMVLTVGTPVAHGQESLQIDRDEFELVWERTEAPVARGDAQRSWLWGP